MTRPPASFPAAAGRLVAGLESGGVAPCMQARPASRTSSSAHDLGTGARGPSRPGAKPDARPVFVSADEMWSRWRETLELKHGRGVYLARGRQYLCSRCASELLEIGRRAGAGQRGRSINAGMTPSA